MPDNRSIPALHGSCTGLIPSRLNRIAMAAGLILILASCASSERRLCQNEEHDAVQETLYFGTARPGGVITANDWSRFLSTAVTPRFPQGFTVWKADGRWRSADGTMIQETSYILNLVYPENETGEKSVLEIIDAYKSQFRQESVLRVKIHACASF